ncbi:unnamed protein product [Dibothriocephalus latus]|uniref:Uncharacterized protein n=1 Tax=Dibothriocephalus latus TaxID=60516 RepID=A0A3P7MGV4_DIBLA|nr:unnamed protein product [Dibothriocephalus latus]
MDSTMATPIASSVAPPMASSVALPKASRSDGICSSKTDSSGVFTEECASRSSCRLEHSFKGIKDPRKVTLGDDIHDWGSPAFIAYSDLFDPANDYVVDDAINARITVEIIESFNQSTTKTTNGYEDGCTSGSTNNLAVVSWSLTAVLSAAECSKPERKTENTFK